MCLSSSSGIANEAHRYLAYFSQGLEIIKANIFKMVRDSDKNAKLRILWTLMIVFEWGLANVVLRHLDLNVPGETLQLV